MVAIPKNISIPSQIKPMDITREIIADSSRDAIFVASVTGIRMITSGNKAYDVETKMSLKLPSPSKSVVRHQLATHQSIRGTITVRMPPKGLEELLLGLKM